MGWSGGGVADRSVEMGVLVSAEVYRYGRKEKVRAYALVRLLLVTVRIWFGACLAAGVRVSTKRSAHSEGWGCWDESFPKLHHKFRKLRTIPVIPSPFLGTLPRYRGFSLSSQCRSLQPLTYAKNM